MLYYFGIVGYVHCFMSRYVEVAEFGSLSHTHTHRIMVITRKFPIRDFNMSKRYKWVGIVWLLFRLTLALCCVHIYVLLYLLDLLTCLVTEHRHNTIIDDGFISHAKPLKIQ